MRISVVIPAINEQFGIAAAVRSARRAGASETIVVDGGSRDATEQLARDAGAEVLRSPPGRAVQQNVGAANATGDVLVFLHADNRFGHEALSQIVRALSGDTRAEWGAMRQRILDDRAVYRWIEWGNACRVRLRGLPFGDQAIFVRRACFAEVGGFPDVPLMEDVMLAQMLRRRCWPLLIRGPVYVDARRWNRRGVARQTWLNWRLQWHHFRGADPRILADRYRRHDSE